MATSRQATGQRGEEIAVRTLQEAGLSIVERNWRCPVGELDIVAEEIGPDYASGASDARWLVLVEVRTRSSTARGTARQAFTPRKQAKLREVAGHYLQEKGWRGPWRIDAVAVQLDRSGREVAVEHIRHAVTG
ncbi:MAG: YraN family protein [Caldilineaceae bacterium]|nr:YraN family protein [Caldilineaceae bacterium]